MTPLVSIVCLCYNHERFVEEAIQSVFNQTYKNIQLILVDDFSSDKSVAVIQKIIEQYSNVDFLPLKKNHGNCAAFNKGLELVKGDFIIDFATDDVMLPNRIENQVNFFLHQNENVGVVFTDSIYIDENGKMLLNHYEHLFKKKIIKNIPTGNVFRDVLTTYFISSPTMMVRKKVYDELNGYDESLAYEDFDFWIRASRNFRFQFLNEKTTLVRKLQGSLSTGLYQKGDKQLYSTFLICQKAEKLCCDEGDRDALRVRMFYEFKHAALSGNKIEARLFAQQLKSLKEIPFAFYVIQFLSFLPLPWAWLRRTYFRFNE